MSEEMQVTVMEDGVEKVFEMPGEEETQPGSTGTAEETTSATDASEQQKAQQEKPVDEAGEPGESEEDQPPERPYGNKKRTVNPGLQRRFKAITTELKDLRRKNAELEGNVQKPEKKIAVKEDFPDDEAFLQHQINEGVEAKFKEQHDSNNANQEKQNEYNEQINVYNENFKEVEKEIPDIGKNIADYFKDSGELDLNDYTVKYIHNSPVGPLVMNEIATDSDLDNLLRSQSLEDRQTTLADLHNKIHTHWAKKQQAASSGTTTQAQEVNTQQKPAAAQRAQPKPKRTLPKPPPNIKSQTPTSLDHLEGDEYNKAFLKKRRGG